MTQERSPACGRSSGALSAGSIHLEVLPNYFCTCAALSFQIEHFISRSCFSPMLAMCIRKSCNHSTPKDRARTQKGHRLIRQCGTEARKRQERVNKASKLYCVLHCTFKTSQRSNYLASPRLKKMGSHHLMTLPLSFPPTSPALDLSESCNRAISQCRPP